MTTTDISLALLLGPQLGAFARNGYDVVGLSAPGNFVPAIEQLGVRHVPLESSTRSRSIAADVRAAEELLSWIRNERPDIVHTHNPKPGVYGRVVSGLARVPLVVNTVHGLYATEDDPLTKKAAVYSLERLAASFSDIELVQNVEDLATLRKLGVPGRKLQLLGNGIDLQRFSPGRIPDSRRQTIRQELGANVESVVITAIGRLVREKGYLELFEAAARVMAKHPNALFAIVGPPDPAKQDGISDAEIAEAVNTGIRFLGHRHDVEDIYAASDIYVLASHREGFPRSAMEAAAMGLPVIATNIRGCRQVVDHELTGLLVAVRDVGALAAAVSRLVRDGQSRLDLGARGRLKALSEFDQERVIDRTLRVYEQGLVRHS